MPAAVPMDLVDPKFTNNGEFDLQVRGRVRGHLENFIRDYMAPGTYSEIQMTPEMDYNCRFYTTRDHFAWAMGKAIADIDYEKFKPTAESDRFDKKEGREYHGVLNSIWGTVTRLGAPGGVWAADYDSKSIATAYKGKSGTVSRGTTFWDDDDDDKVPATGTPEFDAWWDRNNVRRAVVEDDPDYDPDETLPIDPKDRDWWREQLLDEANVYQVPLEAWPDYFTASEFALIKDDQKAFLAARRTQSKRNRNKRRKARNRALRDQA